MKSASRKKAYQWGHLAESLAAVLLWFKGYRIVHMRYKCKVGEVDIIATKGDLLVFVEVKARKDLRTALESLGYQQQQRIIRAASWYMALKKKNFKCRFDMVAIVPWQWPAHMMDAWQSDGQA